MSESLNRLSDLAETAQLRSAELSCLIELLHEMEIDREGGDYCPEYVTTRTMGALRSAIILMADLSNGLNEDVAASLRYQMKGVQK